MKYLLPVEGIVFGAESIPVENNMLFTANNYMAMHQWKKAEPFIKEKLALTTKRLGADNFYTVMISEDLSKVYYEQEKNLDQALLMMDEVVRVKTRSNSKDLKASIKLLERIKAKTRVSHGV